VGVQLSILQKYVFREWLWTFVAVVFVLLTVMIALSFGELLGDVAGGRIPAGLLGLMVLLKMPDVLSNIIPLAVFIAITWGLGRLYKDQEMAVMRASGFGWAMLLRPLFNLLLPISAFALVSAIFLAPIAAGYQQHRLAEAFRSASEWGLQTGQFHVLRGGDTVLYVESVEADGKTLSNIFIQQRRDGRDQVWIAESGFYWLDEETGSRYLTLENGQITEGERRTLEFGVIQFSRNDLRLPHTEIQRDNDEMGIRPSRDLLFSKEPEEIAEIQFRISPAIAVVVLGLLALPLAHTAPREGRGGRIVLGMLAYLIYANVLYLSTVWIAKSVLPPILGLWWVHLLVLVIALIWLHRQGRMGGEARL
jgi:lipopolysaccharide export system permease protein